MNFLSLWQITATRLSGCLCLFLVSVSVAADWYSDAQDVMGTRITVQLWHAEEPQATKAMAAVMAEMRRVDEQLSPYKESSELFLLNATAATKSVRVSDELSRLIRRSLHYSQVSDGAFDISFASLGRFYDYRQGVKPSEQQTQKLLEAIDYHMIDLQGQQVTFMHPELKIDLGGIAKGYAVDRAAALLSDVFDIQHATISAGGDSRVIGDRRGRPWIIGVKDPRSENKMALLLPLTDVAVSTSGDYERFFLEGETRVHHILNPTTGQSATGVRSVTVLGDNALDTDPLSTTVFVLGVERGLMLLNRLSGFDGVIIDKSGKIYYSDGLSPP